MIHPTAVVSAPPYSFFDDGQHEIGMHPAHIHPDVHIQAGSIVEAGTQRATSIGAGCRIGSLVYIGHDTVIETRVEIAAGARIAGWCEIHAGAYIGCGAVLRQHVRIGAGALVGAGAVVVRDVPPNCVVVGNPARVLRLRDKRGVDMRDAKWNGEGWS